jgi:hypothetical protein
MHDGVCLHANGTSKPTYAASIGNLSTIKIGTVNDVLDLRKEMQNKLKAMRDDAGKCKSDMQRWNMWK